MAEVHDYSKLPSNSYNNKSVPAVRSQETFDSAMNPITVKTFTTVGGSDYEEPSGAKKFVKTFIKGDMKEVTSYVVEEKILPGIYDMIMDWIAGMLGLPVGGSRRRSRVLGSRSVMEYNSINDGPRNDVVRLKTPNYNDPSKVGRFETREDAIEVLTVLDSEIDTSSDGMVSVSRYFELIGKNSLIDNLAASRGWSRSQIGMVKIIEDRDGYYRLEFPKTRPIENY